MTAGERSANVYTTMREKPFTRTWLQEQFNAHAAEAVAARDAVWREAIEKLCWPEHAGLILAEVERRTGEKP